MQRFSNFFLPEALCNPKSLRGVPQSVCLCGFFGYRVCRIVVTSTRRILLPLFFFSNSLVFPTNVSIFIDKFSKRYYPTQRSRDCKSTVIVQRLSTKCIGYVKDLLSP
ncbi:uncharacterized protein LOC143145192 isoform X1 [Ptiloglossa arizonensis]|uniref:uncharacterized protein LOC143145192 isoform X1 n=1 Tax=Ptiloglossa arizonensis TaxID=3350558 RepID=UPI003F9F4969